LKRHNADIPVIAKIEKPEALANIREIIEVSDGIMVARGDLGVELPAKKVPIIQNKLIRIANELNKPVIVATQMLESMIDHARPTRAEVTDVAGACLAGADAVMLSAETAAGRYPAESIETMDSILRETEAYLFFSKNGEFGRPLHHGEDYLADAIGVAAAQLSRDLMVRCVFVLTVTGNTARIISSDRPAAPIIALTRSPAVARRLLLLWGVYPSVTKPRMSTAECFTFGESLIKKKKLAGKNNYILMITGMNEAPGRSSSIMVKQVE
jgi:pyruvate kinase